ncbi:CD109 antigen-like [Seriola dumerili]|uniref:CD109 antigen-like n=1 Tax=Seriola dumerili TaxID=41447 RepID=UPI000BBEA177|nr:CD109 antigen-like [Seriola dumerili]
MASYVLLAFFRRGTLIEGIALLKWLSKQRNHLGGYRTTQDTVVALQAVSYYAAFGGANAIDLRLNVSAPASSFVSLFSVNSTNYRILKDHQIQSHTGMAILDVGMLSGFSLSPGAAAPTDLIRKVEILPEKVNLYLDSLTNSEVCIGLPVVRDYKVARVQDAVVQVYDYYEPARKAVRTYNSDFLHNMDSCFFCGGNCDLCRPGITITVSSALLSHSVNSATYSLSCIFLGVTAFFSVV